MKAALRHLNSWQYVTEGKNSLCSEDILLLLPRSTKIAKIPAMCWKCDSNMPPGTDVQVSVNSHHTKHEVISGTQKLGIFLWMGNKQSLTLQACTK